mmetsp:Transcript_33421/g.71039  ORF Transcript_33421/g.71039 Transcript_33421/m.71039 type:complete len:375 (+) Transcript_33421:92-1216(+)
MVLMCHLLLHSLLALVSFTEMGTASRVITSDLYGHMHIDADSNSSLQLPTDLSISGPVDEEVYQGKCPFQEWYSALPQNYEMWEKLMVGKFYDGWKDADSPTGVRTNDHNFNTPLGQGNTLGFVAAQLTLTNHTGMNYGLFAQSGTIPAVVRFSDFGADTSTKRLARMAVKVPLESAWGGEVNLLFTETLDVFPIDDYKQLSSFVGDSTEPWYVQLWNAFGMISNLAWVVGLRNFHSIVMGDMFNSEVLAKRYYSQLPYMLGEEQAMKFSLVPLQKTCENGETRCCLPQGAKPTTSDAKEFASQRAGVTAAYLKECDANFELQLQVKDLSSQRELIFSRASAKWSDEPITVGTLTIPRHSPYFRSGVPRRYCCW